MHPPWCINVREEREEAPEVGLQMPISPPVTTSQYSPCNPPHILVSLLRTNCSREAIRPNSCCYIFAGGEGRWKNSSTNYQHLTILELVGKTLSRMVFISILRYWALLVSSQSDFSILMTIPKSLQSWRSRSLCYKRRGINFTMTNQSSTSLSQQTNSPPVSSLQEQSKHSCKNLSCRKSQNRALNW